MRSFGQTRPVRDAKGAITSHKPSPVRAVTRAGLGHSYGSKERGRRLVVSLEAGDVIRFRQHGTKRSVTATAFDVYAWILRSQAMNANMAKLRERKGRLAQRRANQRQERAERKLFEKE